MLYLRCVEEDVAKYILEEVHEGICGDHIGSRSLVSKIIKTGYFWPTKIGSSSPPIKSRPIFSDFNTDKLKHMHIKNLMVKHKLCHLQHIYFLSNVSAIKSFTTFVITRLWVMECRPHELVNFSPCTWWVTVKVVNFFVALSITLISYLPTPLAISP